jgi:hypothetical protein
MLPGQQDAAAEQHAGALLEATLSSLLALLLLLLPPFTCAFEVIITENYQSVSREGCQLQRVCICCIIWVAPWALQGPACSVTGNIWLLLLFGFG